MKKQKHGADTDNNPDKWKDVLHKKYRNNEEQDDKQQQ